MSGSRTVDRREFLRGTMTAAVACGCRVALPVLPAFLAACGGARYMTPVRQGSILSLPLIDLAAEGSALVEPQDGQLPIYVRRDANGEFIAVLTRCMHRGCQVEPASDRLVCPCHGSEYTWEGAVLRGPTERPLIRYRVTTDAERLYIHLDPPVSAGST